jgi:hypothetical protein
MDTKWVSTASSADQGTHAVANHALNWNAELLDSSDGSKVEALAVFTDALIVCSLSWGWPPDVREVFAVLFEGISDSDEAQE